MWIRRTVEGLMYPSLLRAGTGRRSYPMPATAVLNTTVLLPALTFLLWPLVWRYASFLPAGMVTSPWRVGSSGVLASVLAVILASAALAVWRRSRDRALLRKYRLAIAENRPTPHGVQAIPDDVRRLLEREHAFEQLTESALFEEAQAEALKYTRPRPRNAKRLLNELRLILSLCAARELFRDGRLTGAHVGKWVVLRERWPALARLIAANPELMQAVEATGTGTSTVAQRSIAPKAWVDADTELKALLEAEPKLADAIHRLVHFTDAPAASSGPD
jgi:hypothetical protein